jgi:hypothetical protein
MRARRAKVEALATLARSIDAHVKDAAPAPLDSALTERAFAIDRYEQRARSRRDRAIRQFTAAFTDGRITSAVADVGAGFRPALLSNPTTDVGTRFKPARLSHGRIVGRRAGLKPAPSASVSPVGQYGVSPYRV